MRVYFPEELGELGLVHTELSNLLPDSVDPWLLKATEVDPFAYFNVETS
ncbi:hypothetical protein [Aestuariivirga sp.]